MNKIVKLLNIIGTGFLSTLLRHKVAAGVEHYKLLQSLQCEHFVDIGANRGQFALVARKCFPNARIDSFEPLEEPALRYLEIFSSDKFVELHRLAIGSNVGEALFHVSNRDDSSSLLAISEIQSKLFPGTQEREKRTVNVNILGNIIDVNAIQSPAFLKIDVQGSELDVLRSSKGELHRFKYIYVECSFVELYTGQSFADQVISFLQSCNFVLSGIYNPCYDSSGRAVQADFLFVAGSDLV